MGPGDARARYTSSAVPEASYNSSWTDLPSDDSTTAALPELA
ncbi:hypothetical protein OG301_31105 [Streptomyces platensis]|nr:hypothetical protein OG229_07665 [Streptomyces platensis]WTI55448.1 hypothetical protein OG301_31105 [Streptomyces platensis]